ncbi:MAG: hypothetical protein OIN66_09540 [Candidatus Methanoperedens sp.]|nr:hypothetical protein [Candidatus Methanoperedens sp.]
MQEELKERLRQLEKSFDGKAFRAIIDQVKRDKIKDDEILKLIADISQKRFMENAPFTLSVPLGNLLELAVTAAAVILAFQVNSDWMLYISALVLLTTLHPLSHYLTGSMFGIRFTHYYLDGPARFEPTLKIDYFSYLKASAKARALMHASGVVITVAAPLIVAVIALDKGASAAAAYLFILFLALIVFELLTSTKIGDLMRAKREYVYR